MAPLYPEWSNAVYRGVIVAIGLVVAALVIAPMMYVRTPYNTKQLIPREQPVAFDHRHHVLDDGIDCRYCHRDVETAATAGIPSTDLCMGCHVQVWRDSPTLAAVRESAATGTPIRWVRVHDLADFVYFHHGVHVSRQIACERCHGDVSQMAAVTQIAPLTMGWCVDCHRQPTDLRAPLAIESSWDATVAMFSDGPLGSRAVTNLTTCTACHR